MKKLITLTLAMALAVSAHSQKDSTKNSLEIKIDENTMKIESSNLEDLSQLDISRMVTEATRQMMQVQRQSQKMMARIDKQEASGEISKEEAAERRDDVRENTEQSMESIEQIMETWGEAFETKMEAWATEYEAKMDRWEAEADAAEEAGKPIPPVPPLPPLPEGTAPMAKNDSAKAEKKRERIIINKDGITIAESENEEDVITWDYEGDSDEDETEDNADARTKEKGLKEHSLKKSKKIDRTDWYFDIHFGWNQLLEDGQYLIEDVPGELDLWKSTSFSLGTGAKSRIGSPYSKFYVKYGIDFSWHNFRLTGNQVLTSNSDSSFFRPLDSSATLEKNKYHTAYLNVPIMFQIDLSEPGNNDEDWTFGIGGYAGVRLLAKRELEYGTPQFEEVEEKVYDDFFTARLRYGLMAQIGYEAFKITASYDLNPYFRNGRGPNGLDYNMFNLSIGFTL